MGFLFFVKFSLRPVYGKGVEKGRIVHMKKNSIYRSVQLFVVFVLPLLGLLYAYQFVGMDRGEKLVPFKSFQKPSAAFSAPFSADALEFKPKAAVTLVSFWATWCPPCQEEFPAMVELQRQLEDDGLEIVYVSVDEKWEDVEKYLSENGLHVKPERLLWDPKKTASEAWGSTKFPESYVVRRDGWVVEKIIGAQQWTRPAVLEYFKKLSKKSDKILSPVSLRIIENIFPKAWAADAGTSIETPLKIHEEDQKTLDRLRQNIETASKNLRLSEAALKEEERNVEEQKIVLEQKGNLEKEASAELDKLRVKMKEVDAVLKRNSTQKSVEASEKKKLQSKISGIESNIASLEKKLKEERDALVQANQELGTRVQSIETLEEAEKSSATEFSDLKARADKAGQELEKRRKLTLETKATLKDRERKLVSAKAQVKTLDGVLEKQKSTLDNFEKILKK